jgi:hypothetical protein
VGWPAELALREFGEPAFDQVHPAGAGRGEVQVEPRVLEQPLVDRGGLVGGVVVQDQFLAENEDKVPSDVKSEVTEAIAELKKAIEGNDIETIEAARSS